MIALNDFDEPVCHVGLYVRDGLWDGMPVKIGGFGGVATREDVRRQGLARALIKRGIAELVSTDDIDFGLLFCDSENFKFYEGCGWHRFVGGVVMEQPQGRVLHDAGACFMFELKVRAAIRHYWPVRFALVKQHLFSSCDRTGAKALR